MLIGSNSFDLTEQTMIAALQYYFDSVVFAEGNSPIVSKIGSPSYNSSANPTFRIDVKQREKSP